MLASQRGDKVTWSSFQAINVTSSPCPGKVDLTAEWCPARTRRELSKEQSPSLTHFFFPLCVFTPFSLSPTVFIQSACFFFFHLCPLPGAFFPLNLSLHPPHFLKSCPFLMLQSPPLTLPNFSSFIFDSAAASSPRLSLNITYLASLFCVHLFLSSNNSSVHSLLKAIEGDTCNAKTVSWHRESQQDTVPTKHRRGNRDYF